MFCVVHARTRARAHTHTHIDIHMRVDIRLCMYIFLTIMPVSNTQKIQTHTDTHSSKYMHTHTHTHAAENMVFDKLSYELETLQSSHAPKYEIDRVGKMRANCRCVPHTFLRCERSWSHAHALTRSSIESCELLSLFVLLHLFLT
jgi:hypothetical protein